LVRAIDQQSRGRSAHEVDRSGFASSSPDGLEKVAKDKGFLETARDHLAGDGPLAHYTIEGIDNERLSTGISGLIGVLVTFGVRMTVFALDRLQCSQEMSGTERTSVVMAAGVPGAFVATGSPPRASCGPPSGGDSVPP